MNFEKFQLQSIVRECCLDNDEFRLLELFQHLFREGIENRDKEKLQKYAIEVCARYGITGSITDRILSDTQLYFEASKEFLENGKETEAVNFATKALEGISKEGWRKEEEIDNKKYSNFVTRDPVLASVDDVVDTALIFMEKGSREACAKYLVAASKNNIDIISLSRNRPHNPVCRFFMELKEDLEQDEIFQKQLKKESPQQTPGMTFYGP